ncbi:DsbE family thiol:disulfide interchange protein [Sinisalibacter aestuarii]|uniref:Thiol:disulfide interchange protein n=1 Tax=Sinisalibacter aestuarii TaxID=2949426 RepID=A0ABQ5LS64_9RHOB|nr:DsbE family thiol:disulfide interchange protein [Sinisalibacter aestuarii]GKY87845.1 thiol:disulfide interchange protein [Sinisalibacter aestuarii]
MKIKPMMALPPLIFAGLAAMFLWGMERDDPTALPSTREGGPVPALTLAEFGGEPPFTVDDLADGEVVLVNFWASWCAPCRAEHPQLIEMAEEGISIYGINYKDTPGNAQDFVDELGNPYQRLAADPSGRTGLDWGLYGVPETYVIDGNGTVVKRFAGPITASILENTIRPAIEEARARSE